MAIYKVKHDGKEYNVEVRDRAGGGATVTVEGRSFDVEPALEAADHASASAAPIVSATRLASPAAPPAAAATGGGRGAIHAPIPGVITKICVKLGSRIEAGATVLKLEAMKMENDINSPVAGTVEEIAVAEGAEVRDGQLLVVVG